MSNGYTRENMMRPITLTTALLIILANKAESRSHKKSRQAAALKGACPERS
jgi:hypothetical protein